VTGYRENDFSVSGRDAFRISDFDFEGNEGGTADNPPSFSGTGVFYILQLLTIQIPGSTGGMPMDNPGWWLRPQENDQ
jgi:hypothetical protein